MEKTIKLTNEDKIKKRIEVEELSYKIRVLEQENKILEEDLKNERGA